MTIKREELKNNIGYKIGNASYNYYQRYKDIDPMTAFEDGAEWMQQVIIDKACEWLDNNLLKYWGQRTTDPTEFINEFKQAMEN